MTKFTAEDSPVSTSSQNPDRSALFVFGSIAIFLYIVLSNADPWIGVPLREISSRIAAFVLNSLSIFVERNGTILATKNYEFSVVPACSGSTTLRVLLTLCVIWCGIHPRLPVMRKIFCIVIAVPIALLANGLRVSALVGIGDIILKPVEGAPHIAIGVLTFVLGLASVFLLTELLATKTTKNDFKLSHKLVIIGLVLAFLYTPVWIWIFDRFTTNYVEAFGLAFVAVALIVIVYHWNQTPNRTSHRFLPAIFFALAMFGLARATIMDVRTLQGLTFLVAVFSMVMAFKGIRFAIATAPLLAIGFLGLPMTSHLLSSTFGKLGVTTSLPAVWGIKVGLAAVGLAAFAWFAKRLPERDTGRFDPNTPVNIMLFAVFVSALFQTYFNSKAASFDRTTTFDLSFLVGDDWVGTANPISDAAAVEIGRDRITTRRYTNETDTPIDVIITMTGADRRRAHPPEACMTGTGWKIEDDTLTTKNVGGKSIEVSRFIFEREGRQLEFYYWFSDGEITMARYGEMLKEDLVRRMRGVRTNWLLFRIMAPAEDNNLDKFLAALTPDVMEIGFKESD